MSEGYRSEQETQSNTTVAGLEQGVAGRRLEVALLEGLGKALATGDSVAGYAEKHGLPESTLRYWVSRAQSCGAPEAFVRFIETPDGLDVLHRIVLAARFVLTQLSGGGVRSMCTFLELSGLWRVVASGFGTQQEAVKDMEEAINTFGAEERLRQAGLMAPREITVARDETFHENPCLVAIEPVSNFILLEEYAKDRTADTWTSAMERALVGLPVREIQATSDGGSSLLKIARDAGSHYSPDLFHPQQDISRGTSLALRSKVVAAEQAANEAAMELQALLDEVETYEVTPRGPGRPREYDTRLAEAEKKLEEAERNVEEAKRWREQVREAARAISTAYHPFEPATGAPREPGQVQQEIEKQMDQIEQIADAAGLSGRCRAFVKKARRVVPQMVATIAFVHTMIRERIEALDLAPDVEQAALGQLIPAYYLEELVRKAPTAEARLALRATLSTLEAGTKQPGNALARLSTDERAQLNRVARECAQLFQRSSSNVEGRNGVLALRHHSTHELSPRKLQALTVIHNFWTRRPDATTAAERFFGHRPRDLFEHLLAVTPPPKRPAARRSLLH